MLESLKLEIRRHDIVHKIVEVRSINKLFSLVAWVHGSPAELIVGSLSLHETPHRATHHGHRFLVGHDQDLTHFINCNPLAEELAY